MDEMEYGTVKYTISKLIDKLTWAEHTAGTLQAENDRLRLKVKELKDEVERLERAVAENLGTITYWRHAAEKAEAELNKEFAEDALSFVNSMSEGEEDDVS